MKKMTDLSQLNGSDWTANAKQTVRSTASMVQDKALSGIAKTKGALRSRLNVPQDTLNST